MTAQPTNISQQSSCLAVKLCSENNINFGDTFRFQYVVGPNKLDLQDFHVTQVGKQWVHYGKQLKHASLSDGKGHVFGVILGIAVDHQGDLPEKALSTVIKDAKSVKARNALELYIAQLAGRYAIIAELNGQTMYYTDPVGMIGAVYAAETRRIGATPALCINREMIDHPLYNHEAIEEGLATYGLSHTRDAHVFRLNASHRMNLDTFSSERFWPRPEDNFNIEEKDYAKCYDEIIAATRKVMGTLTGLGPTSLPLSGGNDSRLILALTEPADRPKITQCFTHINNYANRRDAIIGQALCEKSSLKHAMHDRKKVDIPRFEIRKAIRAYRIACSRMGPAPMEIRNGLFKEVIENSMVTRGHQCNIFRGQYLTHSHPSKWGMVGPNLEKMMIEPTASFGPQTVEKFTPEYMKYYNDLPPNAVERAADFIFFETLVPSALGILFPGQSHAFYMSPFNSRRLVQLFMQCDTQYRLQNHTTNDVILRADPGIFEVPFAYELPADMVEPEDKFEKRTKKYEATKARYKTYFGKSAPKCTLTPFKPPKS